MYVKQRNVYLHAVQDVIGGELRVNLPPKDVPHGGSANQLLRFASAHHPLVGVGVHHLLHTTFAQTDIGRWREKINF